LHIIENATAIMGRNANRSIKEDASTTTELAKGT
jgi:hypothetical protein